MTKLLLLILSLTLSSISFAEKVNLQGNYWRCMADDAESKHWITLSAYELTALNRALDDCKKQSNSPSSCKINRESCEYYAHGFSTKPMWRCTALDKKANAWLSRVSAHRDDAALSAKDHCKQESTLPETCYINLLTCKNLNDRH